MDIHGGDWAAYERKYGRLPLDFSQNVSPLGVPEGVRQAAAAAINEAERYPDPLCRELRTALSKKLEVPAEWILCGNGAADLIWRICFTLQPQSVLVTAPGFSEYERAAACCGAEVVRFPLKEETGFLLTEEILDCITPETGIVFLGQPNNPAGVTAGLQLLEKVLACCEANGSLLVMDECFIELLDEPQKNTMAEYLQRSHYLLILRAFTKSFAMAGLRLGYCLCSNAELLMRLQKTGQPWPVSHIAQKAGVEALKEDAYCLRLRQLIQEQRPKLGRGLMEHGMSPVFGEANYLLFFCANLQLREQLSDKGILIRGCENLPGLGVGWYRVAVRTEQENKLLLQAIGEVQGE